MMTTVATSATSEAEVTSLVFECKMSAAQPGGLPVDRRDRNPPATRPTRYDQAKFF
jgi:hypothetical protein